MKVTSDDLNYSTLQLDDNDDEFRARLFAFKAANKPGSRNFLKPYTVSDGNETVDNLWKNYLVLLISDKGDNKLVKVCFPKEIQDNFAIVTAINTNCNEKIEKIKAYKIMDEENANADDKSDEAHTDDISKQKKKTEKQLKEEQEQKEYDNIIDSLNVDKVKIKPKKSKKNVKKHQKDDLEAEALFKFK